jgi:AbrB family looped-hinge helix DNA binding protein
MELAKITTRGQLTLPIAIRKKLNVSEGSKVVFLEDKGRIIIENAGMLALKDAREAMRGVAENLGIKNEQDVVNMVKEVRKERRKTNLNGKNIL